MKNTIHYSDLYTKNKNKIRIESLLFLKERERQVKPKVRFSSQLNNRVVDYFKAFFSQEEYRPLIQDSFGNQRKKNQLKSIIHSTVSGKEFMDSYKAYIADYSHDELAEYIVEKIAGLDVLQPLTEIPSITDIKCIDWNNIWVDDLNKGKYKTNLSFASQEDYLELCHRFAFASGKSWSTSRPAVDAIFPYMRINIVGHDLSPKVSLQIRIITKELRFDESYMLDSGYATQEMINFLKKTFASESHLITGATATGKTELLRYFTGYTKSNADIIMIEDTPETYLDELYPDKPINMWKNREASDDGKKEFGYSYHLRNAMRQNPDYIFIQESRGPESAEILKATATGHIVNTTLHAESAIDAVFRFIDLCQEAQFHPADYYGSRIVRGFSIGIHVKRFGNTRRINQIVEYTGFQDGCVKANTLFEYDPIKDMHVQMDTVSKKLWDRLKENHVELTDIQSLSPYELVR